MGMTVLTQLLIEFLYHAAQNYRLLGLLRGIDRQRGALVVVRPDQYVAQVLPLGDHAALSAYFESFMRA